MTDRAYARISLDTNASGSIAKQRGRLSRHAVGKLLWYVDESVSGSKMSLAQRPAGATRSLTPGRAFEMRFEKVMGYCRLCGAAPCSLFRS